MPFEKKSTANRFVLIIEISKVVPTLQNKMRKNKMRQKVSCFRMARWEMGFYWKSRKCIKP